MSKDTGHKETKESSQHRKPAQNGEPLQEQVENAPDYTRLAGGSDRLESILADQRLSTVQRQAMASQIGRLQGNTRLAAVIQQMKDYKLNGGTPGVQRVDETPPGRGQSTPFGTYWIVPDDTEQSYAGVEGEQITESAYAILESVWNRLESGGGNLDVIETDQAGNAHPGFRGEIIRHFGLLMSQPTGRHLVIRLMDSSGFAVTIRPTSSQTFAGGSATRVHGADALEQASGEAGSGSATFVNMDPGLQDDEIKVFDAAGNEIGLPVFITLGHELIHAEHNALGRNLRSQAATDPAYSNLEEEETIATGPVTENDLRSEHGLPMRHGHAGRDTRPSP